MFRKQICLGSLGLFAEYTSSEAIVVMTIWPTGGLSDPIIFGDLITAANSIILAACTHRKGLLIRASLRFQSNSRFQTKSFEVHQMTFIRMEFGILKTRDVSSGMF